MGSLAAQARANRALAAPVRVPSVGVFIQRASESGWQLGLFAYLQLLDVLTTLAGLRRGFEEVSPFVRMLMQLGPVTGLLLSKLVAFALAGACLVLNRPRAIARITVFYSALIVWNLALLLLATPSR